MDFVFDTLGDAVLITGFDGVATAASAMFKRGHRMQLLPATAKNEKNGRNPCQRGGWSVNLHVVCVEVTGDGYRRFPFGSSARLSILYDRIHQPQNEMLAARNQRLCILIIEVANNRMVYSLRQTTSLALSTHPKGARYMENRVHQ